MIQLYHKNCLDILPEMDKVDCIFADPPDNIGLKYGRYDDRMTDADYVDLLNIWVSEFVHKSNCVWISFNAKWTVEIGRIVARLVYYYGIKVKPCVQTFTFGQHNQNDLGNNHRPLWRLTQKDAPVYPDQVRIPSERQIIGDSRANPEGRVPGDVFDFPRVTGNSKQRRAWHPTQLNEGLVERCIKLSTKEGDWVCDPFAGTGTTLRVCERIGRNCITMDVDQTYCRLIAGENGLIRKSETLWEEA